jgi:signal transduction histidine kinase/predicted RNA-binding protein with RPS1 domain
MTTPPSKKDNFFPDFKERYCDAFLKEKDKGVWFQINNTDYADKAKIIDPEIETDSLITGETYRIFLIQPSGKEKSWFASLKWNQDEKNPWYYAPYRPGDLVSGTITRYIYDYAVIVTLEDGIEAFMHLDEVKGLPDTKPDNIRDILYIGDSIYGEIIMFSPEYLECRLSLIRMYERKKEEYKKNRTGKGSKILREKRINSNNNQTVSYPEQTRVLLIDDHKYFRSSLKSWLNSRKVKCGINLDKNQIKALVSEKKPWHIILDYDLGNIELEHTLQEIIGASNHPVLLCSSRPEARQILKKYPRWFYSSKPLSSRTLDAFLRGDYDKLREIEKRDTKLEILKTRAVGMWRSELPQVVDLLQKADKFLTDICDESGFSSGIWIKKEREGVFSIRAQHGIDTGNPEFKGLEAGLVHTMVMDSMKKSQPLLEPFEKTGKLLQSVAPKKTKTALAFPFCAEGEKESDRVLLFFSNQETDFEKAVNGLKTRVPTMQRFIENIILIEHIMELSAFAPLGLAKASLAHELANRIDPLDRILDEFVDLTQKDTGILPLEKAKKYDQLCRKIPLFQKAIKDIEELIRTELLMVRKKRAKRYSLSELIRNAADLMSYSTDEQRNKGNKRSKKIPITLELPEKDIQISLPRLNIEQPLINLIDNAIFKIQEQGWGEIIIRLKIMETDMKTPVHIEVEDNGYGINAEEMTTLFKPRETSRSRNGNGLGLVISKKMVALINGRLEKPVTRRWYNTLFTLRLPEYFDDMEALNE